MYTAWRNFIHYMHKTVDYCCVHETWWDTSTGIGNGPSPGAAGAFVILQSPVPASPALAREPSVIQPLWVQPLIFT